MKSIDDDDLDKIASVPDLSKIKPQKSKKPIGILDQMVSSEIAMVSSEIATVSSEIAMVRVTSLFGT